MNYPLISEYIEAIKSAENDFEELTHLRPVLGEDGQPVMTSGNFAVVFKMKDEQTGKLYAVKCFTKEQERRGYKNIRESIESARLSLPEVKNFCGGVRVSFKRKNVNHRHQFCSRKGLYAVTILTGVDVGLF